MRVFLDGLEGRARRADEGGGEKDGSQCDCRVQLRIRGVGVSLRSVLPLSSASPELLLSEPPAP